MCENEMDIDEHSTSTGEMYRGNSMEQIYRGISPWLYKHLPDVVPSDNHTVLYHLPIKCKTSPPKPHKGPNKWDSEHVRLPCSTRNQYPVVKDDGTDELQDRWILIQQAFIKPILSSKDLENAIFSYNTVYSKTWKFRALHKLFEEELDEDQSMLFFKNTLPAIVSLALRLPDLVCCGVPLLKQGQNHSVSFTQEQISSLLANAFLCTFPRRNTQKKNSEYRTFPDINFNRLYQSTEPACLEKIRCICNYFRRVCGNPPIGCVTVMRRSLSERELPKWSECLTNFETARLHITSHGTIEDQGIGLLQVDFANKYLGGGVLGHGCVQEEIRFVICPELFITKLIAEVMQKNEAIFIVGCERYNDYVGYASSFKWERNFNDTTPFDESRRRQCAIVAIDALNFFHGSDQYREQEMLRELNKAYVGFYYNLTMPAPGIATGNWGCGAFGGDKRLKALLQLMVCCATERPLVYYTFGDDELTNDFIEMYNFLVDKKLLVSDVWNYLKNFGKQKLPPEQLYPFIHQSHLDKHLRSPSVSPQKKTSQSRSTEHTQSKLPNDRKFFWPSLQNKTNKSPQSSNSSSSCISSAKFYNKPQTTDDDTDEIVDAIHKHDLKQLSNEPKPNQVGEKKSSSLLFDSLELDYCKNVQKFNVSQSNNDAIEQKKTNNLFDEVDKIEQINKNDELVNDKQAISNDDQHQNLNADNDNQPMDDSDNDDKDFIPCTPENISERTSAKKSSKLKQMKLHDIFRRDS